MRNLFLIKKKTHTCNKNQNNQARESVELALMISVTELETLIHFWEKTRLIG